MELQNIRPSVLPEMKPVQHQEDSSDGEQDDMDSVLVVIKTEPDHPERISFDAEDHSDPLLLSGNASSPTPFIPTGSWECESEGEDQHTYREDEDENEEEAEDVRNSLVVIKVEPEEQELQSSIGDYDLHHAETGPDIDLQGMPYYSYCEEDPEHENNRTSAIQNTSGERSQPTEGQHKGLKSFCCSYCGKIFSKSSAFYRHMRIHSGERPFQCTLCNKTFTQSTSFKIHQRIHTGERPYQCSECGKTFKRLDNLRIHQRTHTGEKPYKCSHCPKTFTRSHILQNHERIHTGEKPYQCSFCSKNFTRLCIFQIHLRTHTGERPYQCTACGKKFVDLSNLKNHERIHTQERPYQCSLCDKNFIQLSGLTGHMRKHTGEKPYQCTICGNRYSASSTLHDHRRKKHMPSSTTSTVLLSEPTVLQQLETHDEVVSMRYNDLNMIPIPLETGTGIDSSTGTSDVQVFLDC
ncbi:zinc finger protein 135 [Astyanax mexicanus]|uniref:zinc finger protein 135 n=1 Tax=Astyanax mexicanus TaxID=7994 RepID=UPI0020CB5107|nr:zinc finger protein 135 [Astyanax mexicanus]